MTLEIKHIKKSFGDQVVLDDVSFQLKKEKAIFLIGTNGSGKTTLYNIISGYLEGDAGTILVNGESINKLRPHERNIKGIGRTFQNMRLIGDLTVLENVRLAFQNQNSEKWWKVLFRWKSLLLEQESNKQRAYEILKSCFIEELSDNKAEELSYGQQKLLNIACCIANDAPIILLDEPVAGVNPTFRIKIESIIKDLKANKSLLIIDHNVDFVKAVADEILFLNKGVIVKFENYESMQNDESVIEAYI